MAQFRVFDGLEGKGIDLTLTLNLPSDGMSLSGTILGHFLLVHRVYLPRFFINTVSVNSFPLR